MFRNVSISLCFAAILVFTTPSLAQSSEDVLPDMETIVQAYRAGDFVTARNGLAILAATGLPVAQYRYGRIIAEGRGGPQDFEEAVSWLEKAVGQNQTDATTFLAKLLLGTEGIKPDPERALTLLQRSAARADKEAQFMLARILEQGQIVDQDFDSAFTWYLAAAEQEHFEAQFRLSNAIAGGRGIEADEATAVKWLERSASNGFVPAQLSLATRYDQGRGVEKNNREAINWYRRASETGSPLAQRILGSKYLFGDGVDEDPKEALKWLTAAADAGEPGALSNLGFAYTTGKGVAKDEARAFDFYQQAADRGLIRAMLVVGAMHESGRGTPKDPIKAAEAYQNALLSGDEIGGVRLGALVATGALDDRVNPQDAVPWVASAAKQGDMASVGWLRAQSEQGNHRATGRLAHVLIETEDDREVALKLYQNAAANGDAFAQFQLGELYATGDGVEQDYVQAHKWMNIAATLGYQSAIEKRGVISQLMTPQMLADAQAAAREYFNNEAKRVPNTQQSVTTSE